MDVSNEQFLDNEEFRWRLLRGEHAEPGARAAELGFPDVDLPDGAAARRSGGSGGDHATVKLILN